MSVYLSPIGNAFQFFDTNGKPLAGGLLYSYAAGTSTPATTYNSSTGGTPNANPIVLDASGRVPAEIWLTAGTAYKFVLQTSGAATIATYDNISGVNDFNLSSTTPPTGASLIGYRSTAAGALGTTLQLRLQNFIDPIADYGAVGDGVTDDTTAVQNAITAAAASGYLKFTPGKTFLISGVNVSANTIVDMAGATIKQKVLGNGVGTPVFTVQGANVTFLGGTINGQRGSQPANGFSDSFNTGAGGTGRAFRAAIMADHVTYAAVANLVVRGVTFTQMYGACVATRDVSYVDVSDCYAHDTNFELAWLGQSVAVLTEASLQRNLCVLIASGDATVNADSMYVARYEQVVVANNRTSNGERCGVKIESCTVISVLGNVIDTNTIDNYFGIQLDGAIGIAVANISNNVIYNCSGGILLSSGAYTNTVINSNVIDTTKGSTLADAITITANAGSLDVEVSNNQARNIKRHGMNLAGQYIQLTVMNNTMSGQSAAGSYGLILTATGFCIHAVIRSNVWTSFEQSAVGGGTVNFAGAGTIANLLFDGNYIYANGAANRALRTAGIPVFSGGFISNNFIDGQMELYSTNSAYRNNTVSGVITLPAGIANVETLGKTQTTIGAAGAASALPAQPLGYQKVSINGTTVAIPYYNP